MNGAVCFSSRRWSPLFVLFAAVFFLASQDPRALAAQSAAEGRSTSGRPSQPRKSGTKKPFPRLQVVPLPDDRASFQVDGEEKLCYHWAGRYIRPYWFPLIGPAGQPVTRISHPHDPNGHSHHKSIWIAHANVNGLDFWSDRTPTRIVHDSILWYGDGTDSASMAVQNYWLDGAGKRLLKEIRITRLRPLAKSELLADIELQLTPVAESVTFGKTPFGFLGVRVAKTMGVNDGGGVIQNSEGSVGEKEVFWKRARWVDYTGPIAPNAENGITLMDHPSNPRHPTFFHVRSDGWMGTAFCCEEQYVLASKQTLTLRHRLYVHANRRSPADLEASWEVFAKE